MSGSVTDKDVANTIKTALKNDSPSILINNAGIIVDKSFRNMNHQNW